MPRYCETCCLPFDGARCPNCGRKAKRDVKPDDVCFLTEKEYIWSGLLADALKQEHIPFMQKNVLGAGMALRAGALFESVRFYVRYDDLSAAAELEAGLFSASDREE
ncbi:MAG: hypothetical protein IK104_07180 [Clostridia bacterium]|nr:hypothetical protein [Clostridia bacterium]